MVMAKSSSSESKEPSAKPLVPRKLFKIGEVIQYTGLSRQTIHNYTMLGLLREEERTPSGHRLYGEEVFELIERIKNLRETKSLKEIIEIFKAEHPQDR
jgi:DNA-binding transcriptional MerR regulator